MDKEDIRKKVQEDETAEDYIRCPKCSNSIAKLLAKYPDGCVEDSVIARVLMLEEDEVKKLYKEAVEMIGEGMKDE